MCDSGELSGIEEPHGPRRLWRQPDGMGNVSTDAPVGHRSIEDLPQHENASTDRRARGARDLSSATIAFTSALRMSANAVRPNRQRLNPRRAQAMT
jgi:hypothetical protein